MMLTYVFYVQALFMLIFDFKGHSFSKSSNISNRGENKSDEDLKNSLHAFSEAHCTVFENHRKSLIQHCEQSYIYILSGQKLIKNAKNGPFWRVFENLKLAVKQCYQTGQF